MERFRDDCDEDALRRLVQRYESRARAYARGWLRHHAAAEDAVQDAFIRVVRRGARYDERRPFAPWFWRLLRRVVRDAWRTQRRHARRLEALAAELDSVPPESGEAVVSEPLADLLAGLAADDRHVLLLRFASELSYAEIAGSLGCSEDAAKKRAQRALVRLRQVHAAALARTGRPGSAVPAGAPLPQPSSLPVLADAAGTCLAP